MDNSSEKKVALVIGGNGGIGYSISKRLINDGLRVCATYFNNKNNIESLEKYGEDIFLNYKCDVRSEVEVNDVIDNIILKLRKIDVVVFTVSPSLNNKRILDLTWNDYSEQVELQIKSIFFFVKALGDLIKSKNRIRFIIILSEYCIGKPPKGLSHYVTAKYAAMGMAKTMATELAQYNCTVNMISPGMVDTRLLDGLPPKLIEITADQNPMKRIAIPEDVSNLVSFLSLNESDYLNAVHININGGGVMF
jgi:3-oxoacyl-[acyl-carrier protein] reductase